MPRKATADEDEGQVLSFTKTTVEKYVKRFEKVDAEVDKILAQAKKDCQPHKDDQKLIKKQAAEAGIPKKEFSAILRKRKLLRKAEAVPQSLNDTQAENFDRLQAALGMQLEMPFSPRGTSGSAKAGEAQIIQ